MFKKRTAAYSGAILPYVPLPVTGKILKVIIVVLLLIISIGSNAQNYVLNGSVKDANGNPLPGASAFIPRTNKTAVTDASGKFLLEVNSPDDSLIISNVGYITLRTLTGSESNQGFTLYYDEDKAKMDEVVVVGFGRQKKATLTGAVSSVSVKDVERSAVAQLSNAIGGKLPGIITRQSSGEPGADAAQVFIRGIATFAGASTAPLVFVDGIERQLNNINAMEIESFSILKDASATAVYGVRGANGVILITTKRGKTGKPRVVLRSEYASMQAMRLPDYIDGVEYVTLMNEARNNVGKGPEYLPDEVQKFADGSSPYLFPNVNWTDVVMNKTTWQTINNLNVSGGGEFVKYFANIGYTEQNGIWKKPQDSKYNTNANFRRYNFRSNIDMNLSKSFVVELGLGSIIQNQNYPGTSADGILNALRKVTPINFPVYNPDGSLGAGSMVNANPWGLVGYSGYSQQDQNTVQGTLSAKWDLSRIVTKGLELSGRFGYDHYYFANKVRAKSFAMRRYYVENGEDKYQVVREETPLGLTVGSTANKNVYYEAKLNYNRSFGSHGVSGLLLFNQNEYNNLTTTDRMLSVPYRRRGYAARVTYDFMERYLIEGNFGYNGSENFPPGQKYGFFPSISAGWVVSRENFWGENNPVSVLKIRGSYGKVGNDAIGGSRFLFLTSVNTSTAQGYMFGEDMMGYPGIDENRIGNANVTWEVADKTNIGVDVELLKGKILVQADFFNEDRSSILIQRQDLPFFTGIYPWTIPYGNLGKANNRGFDGMIELKNTTPYALQYSLRGTFTYAKNKVVESAIPPTRYPYQNPNGTLIGQPYVLEAIGLFKDQADIDNSPKQTFQTTVRPGDIKFRDVNGDNQIDANDRIYTGLPRTPQMIFGFGGTVAYKNFDISLFFQGAARTNIFLQGASMYAFNEGFGANNVIREYFDNRFIPGADNSAAKYPLVIDMISENNYRYGSTLFMVDGSFLRLKNAEIGYTVPKIFTGKYKISTARFFINGLNLATWDKIKIIDPESDNGTGRYPLTRNINFGLQVDF
ncbi:MAG: TonB-dependent receptor [Niabella sp.]